MNSSPKYVTFGEAVNLFFQNYVNFNGRSTRSEYWYAFLFQFIVGLVVGFAAGFIEGAIGIDSDSTRFTLSDFFSMILSLAFLLPSLGVTVRRLHDINKSGKLILIPMGLSIAFLAIFIPGFTAAVYTGNYDSLRSLSGLILVFSVVLIAFSIYFLVLLCKKGDSCANRYGYSADETDFY